MDLENFQRTERTSFSATS